MKRTRKPRPEPKPILTLEAAIVEFPNECELLLSKEISESVQHVDFRIWYETEAKLCWAAVRWLAGRKTRQDALRVNNACGCRYWYEWPKDPLRFFLEAVREQARIDLFHEQEKKKKETADA